MKTLLILLLGFSITNSYATDLRSLKDSAGYIYMVNRDEVLYLGGNKEVSTIRFKNGTDLQLRTPIEETQKQLK